MAHRLKTETGWAWGIPMIQEQNRLAAEGGAFAPIASNASDQGRALNRRVEMVLQ